MVKNHQKRVSGPMMDRINVRVKAPHAAHEELVGGTLAEALQHRRSE